MISPHLYRTDGLKQGIPPEVVSSAGAELARLSSIGAFPVLSLAHLARQTGASYRYLREVVSRTRDPYRSLRIAKASGGRRAISAPEPIMGEVQRWILDKVLKNAPIHSASFAYQKGRSILDCASTHQGSLWLVKLDLHEFFSSITEVQVYHLFKNMGYRNLVALELARLTTRSEGAQRAPWLVKDDMIPSYAVSKLGVLPQGAPTSGSLANAICEPLDFALERLATTNGFAYSRYSDDLTFSASHRFDRSAAKQFIDAATREIRLHHLRVHRKKTRVVPPGARKVVLGLLVEDNVRLLPEHRRKIEVHLRGCEIHGLADHAIHRGFESVFSFVNHLDGWIAFAMGIEPVRATGWRIRLNEILLREGLLIQAG